MSSDPYLKELESQSIYVIREAYWEYKDSLALLWSMGKDSTVLVHLARKAFLGTVPIPVIHIDTTFKFQQIYDFRKRYAGKWGLKLVVARNEEAILDRMSPKLGRFECCNALKTEALKQIVAKRGLKALLVAIRRDEHAIRAKERYFSSRDKDFKWDYAHQSLELWAEYYKSQGKKETHFRVHPLLGWREIDIWRYTKQEKLPVVSLYFARKGKRYRSIGCECCCQPVASQARSLEKIVREISSTSIAERSGRIQDKEKAYMMQKLRSLGYM
ncbi:MAG: sulfate adenylyltransferase subunit CysD [Candidatus Omnitrophota bacterium]|jgi:sulfate adenylyltransferase subunit 2